MPIVFAIWWEVAMHADERWGANTKLVKMKVTALPGLVALLVMGAAGCGDAGEFDAPIDESVATSVAAVTFGGHDYTFYQRSLSWLSARSICAYTGSHLATLTGASENSFVAGQAAQHGGGDWWIAYNDIVNEGFWKWDNNEPIGFVNWSSGEPNNVGNEDCAAIYSSTGQWNDVGCSLTRNFVCERDAGPYSNSLVQTLDYSGNDTNSALRNTTQLAVNIYQNDAITFGTCGLPNATLTGDSFLRLYDPFGNLAAFNDDACGSPGSNISYVASTGGQYSIRAGCYDDTACTGHIVIRPEPMPPPHP
jgi:hypothetical protein